MIAKHYTVEHMVWEHWWEETVVTGLCHIEVFYHGGGSLKHIAEGTFTFSDDGRNKFHTVFGEISCDTSGVSGIHLLRVGSFANDQEA